LIAQDLPGYVRQRLVERKIPFVVPGRQMYWPELGLAVQARKAKSVPVPVDILSPVTQVVLIYALTGGMPEPVTPKILAEKLNYATMSMSRALDEIEANKLGHVGRNGRERLLSFPEGRRTLWQTALPFMRNPVRETVRIRKSMLVSPKEQVYALGRRSWKRIAGKVETIPVEDKGTCRVQLWRYDPALFSKEGKVDTFSLYLSMRNEEDERIESALEEMMEKVVWS
jgi:hypothetical protein